MPRTAWFALAAVLGLIAVLPALAEEPEQGAAEDAPVPELASDEQAALALATFKTAFKARGLKGDEKIAEQDWAMRTLAKVQHPDVVDALAKVTKNRDANLRTGAVLQLGNQRRIPAYAGEAVVAAMKRNAKDSTFVMASLEAIGSLRYLGAKDVLLDLIAKNDYAVVKNALITVSELKDARFIAEIIKLMKKLKLEKGATWDGVNVTYDTGAAGDHDQKMAEKIGKAAEAKNKSKGRRSAKTQRDLGPIVLEVMFDLTGEQFTGGIAARKWLDENRAAVDERVKAVEEEAKAQAAALTELRKR